jgi:hypothetical protein
MSKKDWLHPANRAINNPNVFENGVNHDGILFNAYMILPNMNNHGNIVDLNTINESALPQCSCNIVIFIKYMNIIATNKNNTFP